jgi:hypothetical protein
MNNQVAIRGLEVQSGNFSIKLEELQIAVDMENNTAAEYVAMLKQLLLLMIQGENGSTGLEEILAVTN